MNAKRNEFSAGEAPTVETLMLDIGAPRARRRGQARQRLDRSEERGAARGRRKSCGRREAEILAANADDVAAMRAVRSERRR